ncbi:MAG: heparinase II/III-family protein, partial [Lentisphaeria bacterium]|nr:heparinase II/III-family protein [Lentisphaeria bacterium]
DGGYSEGQTYGHKFRFILDGLLAMESATGVDVFQKARLQNSGDFWLYCMSLNYWWNHWGDVYPLLQPMVGNGSDGYIAGLLAHMTRNRALKWYSDTVVCNPAHIPFRYISSTDLKPKPPVDIAQARLFPEVGQLAAYDRFHDHRANRIFFRSSPWGSHSHSHADQNGFVLHAGGEIMACDAGYYTYCGDTYHSQWSVTTKAHNSILVNGKGQPKSIESKGRVSTFFNTSAHCLFIGEAAKAYPDQLEVFDRTVLFLRPDVFIVHDELRATEPSEFSWVLNTFQEAQLDEPAATLVVSQQEQRLRVQHLAPGNLSYTQNNDRPYPLKTKSFCRVTDAFPQHYNIRVTTKKKRRDERILALMDVFADHDGPVASEVARLKSDDALGVSFKVRDVTETVLFRTRTTTVRSSVSIAGLETDARVVSVRRKDDGEVDQWVLHDGARLAVAGKILFSSNGACDAARLPGPGGGQIQIKHGAECKATFRLPRRPKAVFTAPPNNPNQASPLPFAWNDGCLEVELPEAGEEILWIDPAMDLTLPPKPVTLTVTDSSGSYAVELETAVADNGELIAFAELDPREPGRYTIGAGDANADILIQNRWDPILNARARSTVTGLLREATEVFIRYAPDSSLAVQAKLTESFRGRIVNLLRNGDFERGVPSWPPRGWTINHPRTGDLGWPGWSQDNPAEGSSCLRFLRPKDRITTRSQPMRLRKAGKYILRFKARGTATHANVSVSGQLGTAAKIAVEPSDTWQ